MSPETSPPATPSALVRALAAGRLAGGPALQRAKHTLARADPAGGFASNAALLALARALGAEGALIEEGGQRANMAALTRVEQVLRAKPARTLAGVAPVAVMTSPAPCPHGTCLYCPGGLGAIAGPAAMRGPWQREGTPQSYTGHEPAARRGAHHNYDPFGQARARLGQYRANGHQCDKVDLIVMGGTFTARSLDYQLDFVAGAYEGLNAGSAEKSLAGGAAGPGQAANRGAGEGVEVLWQRLRMAQQANEAAAHRAIGLTLETRPDQCSPAQVERMVALGATRVELGVQVLKDEVLTRVGRAHTVEDVAAATAQLKGAGLKVCYHLMPGLPGMDARKDMAAFEQLWTDERFRPDMLKLYPTLVVKGAPLEKLWRMGRYIPYDNQTAVKVVAGMKAMIPEYVRVQRIQRDIPAHQIVAGVTAGNLRQLARRVLAEQGGHCRCIRCAEAGLKDLSEDGTTSNDVFEESEPLALTTFSYASAGATEHFLAYRTSDTTLYGYCRLRLEPPLATVRELKVVGQMVPLAGDSAQKTESNPEGLAGVQLQHKGLGRALMAEAEGLAAAEGALRLRVTAGVGVRPYYRRLGYRLEGAYMVKSL